MVKRAVVHGIVLPWIPDFFYRNQEVFLAEFRGPANEFLFEQRVPFRLKII